MLNALQRRRFWSLLFTFAVAFVLGAFFLHYANARASDYFEQKTALMHETHAQLQRDVASVASPEGLHTMDSSRARSFIAATRDSREHIGDSTDGLKTASSGLWPALFTSEYGFMKFRKTQQTIQTNTESIRKDITPYVAVVSALEHFFAYNPAVDTANFSRGSADTQERMERLRSGLEQARSDVAVYQDRQFAADILELLNAAEVAQEELEQTGDTEAFIATMSELQERTQSVLTSHHKTIHPRLQQNAVDIGRSLP